jgi:hypothetical protein
MYPGVEIEAVANNVKVGVDGSIDSNILNRGVLSNGLVRIAPNMELVLTSTNVGNVQETRGIRMGHINVSNPEVFSNTIFISPNGDISISGTITASSFDGIAGVADPLVLNGVQTNFASTRDHAVVASSSYGTLNVVRTVVSNVESQEEVEGNFLANY